MNIYCPLKEAISDDLAWMEPERTWTFRELDELADCWTAHLRARGVGEGSRIALHHPPCASVAALFFAAWRLRASVCPINLRLPPAAIDLFLKRLQPDLYLTELKPCIGKESIDTLDPNLPALHIMTSGTTAEPKIAVLSGKNLFANAEGAIDPLELVAGDRWLLNLPLFHVGGIGIVIRCILARAAVTQNRADPKITHISCVPAQLYKSSPLYRGLKCLLLGGAPVHSFPSQLPVMVTYGLTEMASIVLAEKKVGHLGFGLPGREVKVAEDGEIWVRGDCLFQGYWKNGQIEKPLDWFATKDLGIVSTEGIAIVGRKDFQFISGGENIQPEEIEKHLLDLDGVEEAAVLPVSDPEFGQRPVAVVAGSLDFDRMKSALLERLPKFKIPIALFCLEELPKKGFKIDRGALFLFLYNKKFNC
ncbi:MAG: AMP-binding protein [Verrucomicrobia bacterium]|nr:AMP-binding protein [Verrucomicrobiota bacterium]